MPPHGPAGYGPPPALSTDDLAVRRSQLRVIGFSVLSFGVYTFYWFYVTRKQLTRELRTSDNAGLQTAGQLVPILNYVITYWLWRDLSTLRTRAGLPEIEVAGYTAANVIASFFGLNFIVYILVLEKLNEYYDRSRGGRAPDAPVTLGEIAVVVVPFLLFATILAVVIILIVVAAGVDEASSGALLRASL